MKICESNTQKMLLVVIDRKLNFDIFLIYTKKTNAKLSALARLSNYMSFKNRKILLIIC